MKRLGILGGMGPRATQHLLDMLLDTISRRFHPTCDQEFPDMTVLFESTTPDRTGSIKSDATKAAARINRDIAHLLSLGCKPIGVACITAHSLIGPEFFERGVVDFRSCLRDKHRELEDAPIGVLATDGSIANGVFKPLEERFTLIYPTIPIQESVMMAIYGARGLKAYSIDHAQCRHLIDEVVSHLQARGAEAFLVGCTELEMFMAEDYAHLKLLLPMACLCECLCDLLENSD